jgi:hypothetical protein
MPKDDIKALGKMKTTKNIKPHKIIAKRANETCPVKQSSF